MLEDHVYVFWSISFFFLLADTNDDGDTKKVQALKLLALKVASHLKWNLDVLEDR